MYRWVCVVQVREAVDAKCKNPNERDKFQTYIDDLEKIVRLLLNLSGQLARAENAVQGLPDNADPKLKVSYEIIWGGGIIIFCGFPADECSPPCWAGSFIL